MSRRKLSNEAQSARAVARYRAAIPVEVAPPMDMTRWNIAGAKLRRLDPEKFNQMFRLVEAYVVLLYTKDNSELEPIEEFKARLERIRGNTQEAN